MDRPKDDVIGLTLTVEKERKSYKDLVHKFLKEALILVGLPSGIFLYINTRSEYFKQYFINLPDLKKFERLRRLCS